MPSVSITEMLSVEKCGDTGTGKISFPSGFALVHNLIQMAMSMIILPLLSALVCLMLLCRVEGMKQNAVKSIDDSV